MALKPNQPTALRLHRRLLILIGTVIPLVLALYGFGSSQTEVPRFPATLQEPEQRGRILARDGTILAEGGVEHREYPQGSLGAHLVGFSGALQADGRYGLEGIELTQDSVLQGGDDVILTLDPNLQAVAQTKLAETVEGAAAESGAVVILEASTGRILAAASYPDYDPNRQGAVQDRGRIVNRAFMHRFEPGSVMKPFVIASLLESGRLRPDEVIETPMQLREGDKTFHDVAQHDPQLTVWDVLSYSSNSGMINLTKRFTDWELRIWLSRFGFGRDLDFNAVFTRTGLLRDTPWVPQDQASITIGQSMSTTALQLAAAYSIFANDGVYVPPYLIEGQAATVQERVISPEIATTMRAMLRYVAETSGVSHYPIPGVSFAGKTGTADIFDSASGTYVKGDYTLTFAGMVPADRPRFTMVVTVQKPRNEDSSTAVAAPLFSNIARETIALWQVPPAPVVYATSQ